MMVQLYGPSTLHETHFSVSGNCSFRSYYNDPCFTNEENEVQK